MSKKLSDCLIEFFSEEIPANMQISLEKQLVDIFENELKEKRLNFSNIEVFSSPRRLAVKINNLQKKQDDKLLNIKGPSILSPEVAISGFAKSQNTIKSKLIKNKTNKGEFFFLQKLEKGKNIFDLLPELINEAVKKINWPKSQRWGNTEIKWGRPLRNILAIVDNKKIKGSISLGGDEKLIFNDFTFSHRHFNKKITIDHPNKYKKLLKKNGVFVYRLDRKEIILNQINIILKKNKLKLYEDNLLLEEVIGLVELPNVLLGKIDRKFMKLPFEVLSTSMKVHQKYFSLLTNNNNASPFFVLVANTPDNNENNKTIVKGNERVLKARLSDALFFWESDLKKSFDEWLEDLKSVVFYENLGNLYDRSIRISKISINLSKFFEYKNKDKVKQLGLFSKVDLVSNMVGEFPELQGVMGGYYSKNNGFDNEFKIALIDQYKPIGQNDQTPRNKLGCILSISNNLDTLNSFFSIGLIPTGSRDPFALRRAANGIIKILIQKKIKISLNEIIKLISHKKELMNLNLNQKLIEFILERFIKMLLDDNYKLGIINAIISNPISMDKSLFYLLNLISNLSSFSSKKIGKNFITNYKRIFNILKNVNLDSLPKTVDESIFENNDEKTLNRNLQKLKALKIENNKDSHFDKKVISSLVLSTNLIENFFNNTLVNVENEKIRFNRLKLLYDLKTVFSKFANFEKIED